MALAARTKLGPHEIIALIGAGGMGEVYSVFDTKLNRPVAVKLLSEELADTSGRRRFQREAQTVSSLPTLSPSTIPARSRAGSTWVRNTSTGARLKTGQRKQCASQLTEIVELLVGVADALSIAHDAGILHRDIKPANILITKSGYANLADFGLAKLVEAPAPDAATRTMTEGTRPGVVVGTIAYMSPEQAAGKPLDARSDVFSFRAVLYQMLVYSSPHDYPFPVPPHI